MSFFKKLFSSSYRAAIGLEASGNYDEAAKHYLMAGERRSVARMHALSAKSERDPYKKVDALRRALDFGASATEAPGAAESMKAQEHALADALVALTEHNNLMDRADRARLEEAAEIYLSLGEHNGAGEAYAKLGFLNRAADAFKTAGNIGRMEEMFDSAEAVDVSDVAFDTAFDAYEFARMAGDHIGAVEALERCVELRPQDAGLAAKLHGLKRRIPQSGRISLQAQGSRWVLLGGDRIEVGREDDNEILLLDPGVSRKHAAISASDGAARLEDLGSSHGTFLDDSAIDGSVALAQSGTLNIGKDVRLNFTFQDGMAPPCHFVVTAGYLKGQRFTWTPRIITRGASPEEPDWMPPGIAFEYRRAHWHLVPEMCQGPVTLSGKTVTAPTLLRSGDEIVFSGVSIEVE